MTLKKLVIAANVGVFVAFGLAFLIAPHELGSLIGIQLTSATAVADFRAMYGGYSLGMGLFFAVGIVKAEWERPALYAGIASAGGMFLGRLITILTGTMPGPEIYAFMVAEVLSVVAAFWVLSRESRPSSTPIATTIGA